VRAKFQNAIGSIIRTKMVLDPAITDWTKVPEGRKEMMWQLLSQTFILPRAIARAQWEEFVQQKTSKEDLALS
jgi:hypothetical protein